MQKGGTVYKASGRNAKRGKGVCPLCSFVVHVADQSFSMSLVLF